MKLKKYKKIQLILYKIYNKIKYKKKNSSFEIKIILKND